MLGFEFVHSRHETNLTTFYSFPQTLDRTTPGSYSYSPYSTNYKSDNSFNASNSSSYIQSTYSPQFHHQMFSHSQNVGIPSPQHFKDNNSTKKHFIRYGSSSELSKRTQSQGYELSQDLQDKQIELLERKYGGRERAQKAALVIYFEESIREGFINNWSFFNCRFYNELSGDTCSTENLHQ